MTQIVQKAEIFSRKDEEKVAFCRKTVSVLKMCHPPTLAQRGHSSSFVNRSLMGFVLPSVSFFQSELIRDPAAVMRPSQPLPAAPQMLPCSHPHWRRMGLEQWELMMELWKLSFWIRPLLMLPSWKSSPAYVPFQLRGPRVHPGAK